MANEDTACIEANTGVPACETERPIPLDAHKGADWGHKTLSQKPRTARVARSKPRPNLTFLWYNSPHGKATLQLAGEKRACTLS